MKAGFRPQYYRIRRMVQMVREGAETGYLPNSSDFMREVEVSRRTVARDLDFLRDEERAPLAYDNARHGFRLTDETYTLPPVRISRKEAFSFGLARKLLTHYEGTPLHLDTGLGPPDVSAGHHRGLSTRCCSGYRNSVACLRYRDR
jgi:proteasome accessory factor B